MPDDIIRVIGSIANNLICRTLKAVDLIWSTNHIAEAGSVLDLLADELDRIFF